MQRQRGPYKRYLLEGSNVSMPSRTRRRRNDLLTQFLLEREHNEEPHMDDAVEVAVDVDEPLEQSASIDDESGSRPTSSASTHTSEGSVLFHESENEDEDLEFSDAYSTIDEIELDESKPPFRNLISFITDHAHITNLKIDYSVGEIMFLIITFCIVHNLTLTAMCDMMKLLNVLCAVNLFPSSRFRFKKLFNPSYGMQVHYTCEVCGHYLGKKNDESFDDDNKTFTCKCCGKENIVTGFTYNCAFVTVDIARQVKDLLLDPSLNFQFSRTDVEPNIFSDISSGSMYRNNVPDTSGLNTRYLTFTFNSDASPVSKDGKTKINPIYLMVNELDYRVRSKHLVLAGLTYGKTIIRNDVFLKPFVEEMNELATRGFNLNLNGEITKIKMLGICCCVDSVARAPMQGIKAVNGYFCCSWCHLSGELLEGTRQVKYPIKNKTTAPRSERSFKMCTDMFVNGEKDVYKLKGINSVSPLLNLHSFSMIWSFVPDMMHLVLIGITSRFLDIWFDDANAECYIGSPIKVHTIDNILKSLRIPTYLKKAPETIKNKSAMKSKHFENWLLFYSIPTLKAFLPQKFYNHWKLIVEAVSLLMQDVVTLNHINLAEQLLFKFVNKTEDYYGKYEMTYNMHQLLHLSESVRRWGPLWAHTAYPFESGIGYLKSALKASKGIPQQVIRCIELNRAVIEIYKNCNLRESLVTTCEALQNYRRIRTYKVDSNVAFLGVNKLYEGNRVDLPEGIDFFEYSRAVRDGITFSKDTETSDKDDSYVELFDGSFSQIKHILCSNTEPADSYVITQNIIYENEPRLTHIKRILARGHYGSCKFADIKSVAVRVFVDNYNEYICTIPIKHYSMNL